MSAVEHSSAPSLRPSDYLLDINKVLLAMADNELLLNSSELSGGLYEDFSSQEDTLRVRWHSNTKLKSHISYSKHIKKKSYSFSQDKQKKQNVKNTLFLKASP